MFKNRSLIETPTKKNGCEILNYDFTNIISQPQVEKYYITSLHLHYKNVCVYKVITKDWRTEMMIKQTAVIFCHNFLHEWVRLPKICSKEKMYTTELIAWLCKHLIWNYFWFWNYFNYFPQTVIVLKLLFKVLQPHQICKLMQNK